MFIVGFVRLMRMKRLFRRSRLLTDPTTIADLPSVSVCIPARNEGHAMTDSLDRIIASTYPKLETIVLDDQSGDETSSLIKAFAHDGVRFVEGSPLRGGWIGKNHSLNELLKEASGTYILYMDVDTRISPNTIEQLVAYALQEKAAMVSVLPRREDGVRLSTLFSSLRYLWELLFHSKQRPAVASSAWLIHRESFIAQFTDFTSFSTVIQPEAAIARIWALEGRYRFLIGTSLLGVSYEKKWSSQRDTSIRLLFPLLGKRPLHALVAILDLLLLVSPVMLSLLTGDTQLGLSIYVLGAIFFASYYYQVWRRGAFIGGLLWPIVILQEAYFVFLSMVHYLQGTVTWKGRPVEVSSSKVQ